MPDTPEEVQEKPSAFCDDCGRRYGNEFGFPDLVVSHEVWEKISGRTDGGGLLCPSCMCRRAAHAGLTEVEARFTSGPFAAIDALGRRIASLEAELREERQRWEDIEAAGSVRPPHGGWGWSFASDTDAGWDITWPDATGVWHLLDKQKTAREAVDEFRRKVREGSNG